MPTAMHGPSGRCRCRQPAMEIEHDRRTRPQHRREHLRRPTALGDRQAAEASLDVADLIAGSVLDAGCGTGENALYFAGRGCTVTGIDFLEEPINRAKRKAAERGLPVTFLVKDALM